MQYLFKAFVGHLTALWTFVLIPVGLNLTPRGTAFFRRTREATFGKTLEDLVPKGSDAAVEQWGKLKEGLDKVDRWYVKSGGGGPYYLGDTIFFADLTVIAYFAWMRTVWAKDSQKWKDISSWHGGRWKRLLDNLKEYEIIV